MPSETSNKAPRTCDACRKRKIKCVEDTRDLSNPCDGCRKLNLDCSYDYVKKKPGRKNSFALAMKAAQGDNGSMPHPTHINHNGNTNGRMNDSHSSAIRRTSNLHSSHSSHDGHYNPYPILDTSLRTSLSSLSPTVTTHNGRTPIEHGAPVSPLSNLDVLATGSFDPNGSFASTPGRPWSSFAFSPRGRSAMDLGNFDWLDSMLEGTAAGSIGTSTNGFTTLNNSGNLDLTIPSTFISDQAHLLASESPENLVASGSSSTIAAPAGVNLLNVIRREPQLEDVTSWANISHFISLFLQYLYPLLPLVHRPTFAEHLATRRDLRDTDFRALLLSIVAYVISQLPTSRLVTDVFDIEGLKRLQRRCHRTCKALQRTYYGPTNLTQITTIIFDTFYLLSIGLGHTAGSRMGQAVQLAFSMGMHSDDKTNALGLDTIEVQLRRRVFWQLYASDKTRAIPGLPMLINDFQGVCSIPEPIDDEFITSQGMFPQPPSRTSVLAGFVCLSKIFRILSECFFHHRCLATGLRTITMDWSVDAEDRLHQALRDMPAAIQDPTINTVESMRQVFAMQRANILITAAIAKFALYDLRASLHVDEEQLAREREGIAREIHSLLMNIPVEDLASNGESMRGKVFHIACALCAQASSDDSNQELIKDWCNMFSAISFVQMPPPPPGASALDSRANSPPAREEPFFKRDTPVVPTGPSTGGTTIPPGST